MRRHTRGLLRSASNFWFVLIGLSTLLTYQHHLMDVVAGFALGVYCLYFIRESAPHLPVIANRRVGSLLCHRRAAPRLSGRLCFGHGARCCFGRRLRWASWRRAYFGLGPGIFRKAKWPSALERSAGSRALSC